VALSMASALLASVLTCCRGWTVSIPPLSPSRPA
jgi:hypothetical protein